MIRWAGAVAGGPHLPDVGKCGVVLTLHRSSPRRMFHQPLCLHQTATYFSTCSEVLAATPRQPALAGGRRCSPGREPGVRRQQQSRASARDVPVRRCPNRHAGIPCPASLCPRWLIRVLLPDRVMRWRALLIVLIVGVAHTFAHCPIGMGSVPLCRKPRFSAA